MPWKPNGANPPAATKLPGWKLRMISVTIVSSGTNVFQMTIPVLLSESQRAPPRLMNVNSSIARMPTTMPWPVSVPSLWMRGKTLLTLPTELT